jgi:hypothetical protein
MYNMQKVCAMKFWTVIHKAMSRDISQVQNVHKTVQEHIILLGDIFAAWMHQEISMNCFAGMSLKKQKQTLQDFENTANTKNYNFICCLIH